MSDQNITTTIGWRSKAPSFAQMKVLRYMVWNYKINVTIPKTRGEVSDLITRIENKIKEKGVTPRLNKLEGKVLREENLLHFIIIEKKYTYTCIDCGVVYKTDEKQYFTKNRHCPACAEHIKEMDYSAHVDEVANADCR